MCDIHIYHDGDINYLKCNILELSHIIRVNLATHLCKLSSFSDLFTIIGVVVTCMLMMCLVILCINYCDACSYHEYDKIHYACTY